MIFRFTALVVIALLALSPRIAFAQPGEEQQQRVDASFLLAFGRAPTVDESREFTASAPRSVEDLLNRHGQHLATDAALRRSVIVKAGADAFGRALDDAEIATHSARDGTYAARVLHHVQWLTEHPDEYQKVIDRACQLVVHRPAHTIEYDYWKSRDTLPFFFLVACIDNWAQRNAPGLMSTTGVPSVSINSAFLTTTRLTPAVAREARVAVGLAAPDRAAQLEVSGHTIVAPAAGGIVSVGGIHFVTTGRR